jgi:osmotically inducible protein OsmC
MKKTASAHWQGDLKQGNGHISTESGVLDQSAYGFNTRFEDGPGTNPEELIGAAHAACFSMALSNELGQLDLIPDSIDTKAVVTLEDKDGFTITAVHLSVDAVVPKATEADFEKAANAAKTGCPVSKLLKAEISLETKFSNGE